MSIENAPPKLQRGAKRLKARYRLALKKWDVVVNRLLTPCKWASAGFDTAVGFLLRIKLSYFFIWIGGFLLVYWFHTQEPGMGADEVMVTTRYEQPPTPLWGTETEAAFLVRSSAVPPELPQVMLLPLTYKPKSPSLLGLFNMLGDAPEAEAKPLTVPGIEALPVAAAYEPGTDAIAAVYPDGDHWGMAVWDRLNPLRKTAMRLHIPRLSGDTPVTVDDVAWLRVAGECGPRLCVVVFFSNRPRRAYYDTRAPSPKTSFGVVWHEVTSEIDNSKKENKTKETKTKGETANASLIEGEEPPTRIVLGKESSALLSDLFPNYDSLKAKPRAWASVGTTNLADASRRLVTLESGPWHINAAQYLPYIFSLTAKISAGAKGDVQAVMKPLPITLTEPYISWSGWGRRALYYGPEFNPGNVVKPAGLSVVQEPWYDMQGEGGRHRGAWKNDLYAIEAPTESEDAKSPVRKSPADGGRPPYALLNIHSDGSRYPVGLRLSLGKDGGGEPISCFLFVSAMNRDRLNLWLYRDFRDAPLPYSPRQTVVSVARRHMDEQRREDEADIWDRKDPFHYRFKELTFRREIIAPPLPFHANKYFYVSIVSREEFRNIIGERRFAYRFRVMRWDEQELYRHFEPLEDTESIFW